MNNLISFVNSFLSYGLLFLFVIVLALIACFIGISMRKRKNAQIEVVEGKLTGRFKSNNCYGAEKVCRITEALSASQTADTGDKTFLDRSLYEIEAFGDSRGDKEMLAFADQGHYKPFRE